MMSSRAASNLEPTTLTERDRETFIRSFDIKGLRLTREGRTLVIEGQVSCYRTKKLAGEAAARLIGDLNVVNRLRVVPESHRRRRIPPWAASFLKQYKPPTAAELKRRKKAFERALAIREELDIRPLTTGELVRQLRDESP